MAALQASTFGYVGGIFKSLPSYTKLVIQLSSHVDVQESLNWSSTRKHVASSCRNPTAVVYFGMLFKLGTIFDFLDVCLGCYFVLKYLITASLKYVRHTVISYENKRLPF